MCKCFRNTSGDHQPTCPCYVKIKPMKAIEPKGWTCPKCGNVYAPGVQQCYACNSSWIQPWVNPFPRNPWRIQYPYEVIWSSN